MSRRPGDARRDPATPSRRFLTDSVRRLLMPGADTKQGLRMRRYYAAAATSLLALGVFYACYLYGALPHDAFMQVALFIAIAIVGFFFAFRTGFNLRFSDPSLTLAQMLAATAVIFYSMYRAENGRAVYVILLLMAFVFGVLRLNTRSLLAHAGFIVVGYAAVVGLRWRFHPAGQDLNIELLQLVALALTLPWFALMGGYISNLRQRLRKSNAELQTALVLARAGEASLAEAQRMAQLGSWSFDPVRKLASWSAETYRIFGLQSGGPVPVGETFRNLIHEEDRARYLERLGPALAEGRAYEIEYRIVRADGEVRWVRSVAEPVIADDGHVLLLRGTVTDITERKAQAEALTAARDQAAAAQAALLDAIESMTDGFALFDAQDRLILCNRPYARLFTHSDRFEDIAGMRFEDLVRSSLAQGEVIEPRFAGDIEAWVAERVRRHRNPGPEMPDLQLAGGRWVQITERRTQAGGIVGMRRDITQRKQLEQRQTMEHAVTRLLAEGDSVADTMPRIIQTICETLGWHCGARWWWDEEARSLRCAETWSIAAKEVREFVAFSAEQRFSPSSTGLIRRAWSTGEPVWIADVSQEPGFLRAPNAAKAGLHAALAFPILIGTQPQGVMEFFLRDPREPDQSLVRVTRSIGMQLGQFIARKAAQDQLRQLAHFDFLSGLPNRTLLNQVLEHALNKAQRRRTSLALLFIDLDGFKDVNDRFGHDAGDHLLATFAQRLRESLRKSDLPMRLASSGTPARFGGDEFVVVVDDASEPSSLAKVAQKILAAAREPFDFAGSKGNITASIGIAVYPLDGADLDELMRNADSAMYAVKQAGGNGYRFFSLAAS
jgi:diguanylate cyclase (GGDEF)-like protein/PAS domain S-box-containing protein